MKEGCKRLFYLAYIQKTKPVAPYCYISKNCLTVLSVTKIEIKFLFANFFLFFFDFKIFYFLYRLF